LYVYEDYGAKYLLRNFPINVGSVRLCKHLKKLQETDTMARRSGSIKSIQHISYFSIR